MDRSPTPAPEQVEAPKHRSALFGSNQPTDGTDPSQSSLALADLPESLGWTVLEDTPHLVWLVDGSGHILWSNRAGAAYLSNASAAVEANLFVMLPPDKAQHRRLMLNAVRRTGEPVEFVDYHGSWWDISVRVTSIPDVFVFWQRNVDRRVIAEEDLRRSLSRAVTIQEDERRRISRDLHDETGQALTGLLLELRELSRRLEGSELRDRSDRAAEMAATLMRQMRTVLHQLNPPSLKSRSLEAAMGEYCALFKERTEIQLIFEAVSPPRRLADDQSTTLYRLLQEALTNVARHAGASTVWVSLAVDDEEVILSIEDDGVGFEAESVDGSGLLGIRERFAMLDGHIEIETTHGGGVRLEGALPLKSSPRRPLP